MARRYDGTVARIAGNLLAGHRDLWMEEQLPLTYERVAQRAVALARCIVKETIRTEPTEESFHDTRDKHETE